MAKTLKTKKLHLYMFWLNSNIKPSEYSTAEEMNSIISEVRTTIAEEIPEFIENNKKILDIQRNFALEDIDEKEANKLLFDLNRQGRKMELTIGEDTVEVELDKEDFGHMLDMFNRLGKEWFNNPESYIEFDVAMNDANKDKPKK